MNSDKNTKVYSTLIISVFLLLKSYLCIFIEASFISLFNIFYFFGHQNKMGLYILGLTVFFCIQITSKQLHQAGPGSILTILFQSFFVNPRMKTEKSASILEFSSLSKLYNIISRTGWAAMYLGVGWDKYRYIHPTPDCKNYI